MTSNNTIAASNDGNKLLVDCKAAVEIINGNEYVNNTSGAVACLSYLQGFADLNTFYRVSIEKKDMHFCIPNGVDAGQKARVVVNYLEANPNELHNHKGGLVWSALKKAFPCSQ